MTPSAPVFTWPEGVGRVSFPEIDSTNEEARRQAVAGEAGPLWLRADRQTAGRGRRGRAWASPSGNLMASLLLRPACDPAAAAQISFVAALAVGDLVLAVAPQAPVALKWPNDVLVGGAKIAGILLESGARADGRIDWLAVGIGVNLAYHPADTPYPATHVALHAGADLSPDAALTGLAAAMDRWLGIWDEGRGFAAIRSAWLARAHGLGQSLTARLAERVLEGRFAGLEPDGALVLTDADGQAHTVHGGEVFFNAPAPGSA